jgi:hypothetical protein
MRFLSQTERQNFRDALHAPLHASEEEAVKQHISGEERKRRRRHLFSLLFLYILRIPYINR